MQRSSLSHWKVLKFHTVKLKNLRNETALEMKGDTQKDNAYFIKKKKKGKKNKDDAYYQAFTLFKKGQHLNAFSFSSGNKILTRRKAEPFLCSSLKRQIQRVEEVTGRVGLFPP